MTVPDDLRDAIKRRYNAEDVKVISKSSNGGDEVLAYGMLPDTTIFGWFPLGDLDELEKKLRDNGEL
jgi:hypothetical protein